MTKTGRPSEDGYRNSGAGYRLAYFDDRQREGARIMFESMILMVEYKGKKEEEEVGN